MNSFIEKYRPHSIWITALAAVGAYLCLEGSSSTGRSISLFNVVLYIGWAFLSLIALASAPFALLTLWRIFWNKRHRIRPPAALAAKTARSAAHKAGIATQITARSSTPYLRHAALLGKSAWHKTLDAVHTILPTLWWGAANLVLTFSPVILFVIIALAQFVFLNIRLKDADLFIIGFLLTLPYLLLFIIWVKTVTDMKRVFTFSPALVDKAQQIFLYLAIGMTALNVIVATLALGPWMFVALPLMIVQTGKFAAAVIPAWAGLKLIALWLKRRAGTSPPQPPIPKPDPRWMDDPVWTEVP